MTAFPAPASPMGATQTGLGWQGVMEDLGDLMGSVGLKKVPESAASAASSPRSLSRSFSQAAYMSNPPKALFCVCSKLMPSLR